MPVSVQRVVECVREVTKNQEKLVFIAGRPGSGKSKVMRELAAMRGWEYVDCRMLITDEFLEMNPKSRPVMATPMISKLLDTRNAAVILLDAVEILFAPVLNLEPFAMIRNLSRKHILVVAWPGELDEDQLTLDYNGQEKYAAFTAEDFTVIQIA